MDSTVHRNEKDKEECEKLKPYSRSGKIKD